MAAKKSSGSRKKYGEAASKSVESAMHREKKGTLRSGKGGKGGKVTSRKQAIRRVFLLDLLQIYSRRRCSALLRIPVHAVRRAMLAEAVEGVQGRDSQFADFRASARKRSAAREPLCCKQRQEIAAGPFACAPNVREADPIGSNRLFDRARCDFDVVVGASVFRCPTYVRSTSIIGRVRSRSGLRSWARTRHPTDIRAGRAAQFDLLQSVAVQYHTDAPTVSAYVR